MVKSSLAQFQTEVAQRIRPYLGLFSAAVVGAILLAFAIGPGGAVGEQAGSRLHRAPAGYLDAGGEHSCAVLASGSLRCWGRGENTPLGYGNELNIGDNEKPLSAGPINLGPGRTALAVSAGLTHICAILDNHSVRCWGQGLFGQLGYGNAEDIGDNETPAAAGPVDLGLGHTARAISAGAEHTCAIRDDGKVLCWGFGGNGRLGYGSTANVGDNETPAAAGPVDLGPGRTAKAISSGGSHSCAILDNGRVRCWGLGGNGQLGYANTRSIGDDETPASAGTVHLGKGRKAVAISSGALYSCALLDNRRVRCWGAHGSGRLGIGGKRTIGDNETPASIPPVDLGRHRTAVAIGAGTNHSCAILDNGRVRCWGFGANGRLGYGNEKTIGDGEVPGSAGPVYLGRGRRAVAITTGSTHTCALLDNRRLRCWGKDNVGQLGYGNTVDVGDNESPARAGFLKLGGPVRIKAP